MELPILAICIMCLALWRTGVLVYLAGASRSKHVISALLRSICDMVTSTLCFWAVGSAILLQEQNAYLGLEPGRLCGDQMTLVFTLAMVLVGTAPSIGAMAERGRFLLVAPMAEMLSMVIIPVVGQWTWHGLLVRHGGVDVAGALPIVLCPAVVGLVSAAMVGPRMNKYNRDGSANAIPGHSAVFAAGGMVLMLAGWLAYLTVANFVWGNVGIWRTLLDGMLAACAGCASAMVFGAIRYGKADLMLALMGMAAGMLSTAAGASMLPPWFAVLLGAAAGVLGVWCAAWVDVRWRIDDASNLMVVMIVSSVLSLLATPLVVGIGWVGKARALGANSVGIALGLIVAGLCTWSLLAVIRRFAKLRVSEAAEYDGLDLAEHDQNAYPDFQQTMIKSYHLREA